MERKTAAPRWARDIKAQMRSQEVSGRDLKAQLRSQEVLKALMMEVHQRMLAANGGGREQQPSAVKPTGDAARPMPQLPYLGLDRRSPETPRTSAIRS